MPPLCAPRWPVALGPLVAHARPSKTSRQAKRSSPLPARCKRPRSKPKSLRICFPYHESKGASDAASSRKHQLGVFGLQVNDRYPSPEGFGASHTDSAVTPSRRLDWAYSS